MQKSIYISLLLCPFLMAESFDTFLNRAVNASSYIKASSVQIEQKKQEIKIADRLKNPTLELELSNFNSNEGNSQSGFRTSVSQPLPLWGVRDDKVNLAKANADLQKSNHIKNRADFTYNLSLKYLKYVHSAHMLNLSSEALELAKTIYDISKARYDSGTVPKGVMLQASVDFNILKAEYESMVLNKQKSYYSILKSAGINEEVDIDTSHTFTYTKSEKVSPLLLVLKDAGESALKSAQVNSNSVEWIDINAEMEKESNQDIYRVSLSIPLSIFNTKDEERSIAKLKAKHFELLKDQEEKAINIELKKLNLVASSLLKLQESNKAILKDEEELLAMFKDGYKIANVNLLELQDIKNKLLQTKKRIINIEIDIQKNAIEKNYLQGNYND